MHESELVNTLKKLSTREKTKFKQWIESSFVNRHVVLVQLATYLLTIKLKESNSKLNKEQVFQHLFPNELYDALKLNNFTSDLLQLLHDFLAYQAFYQSSFSSKLNLVKVLFNKGLIKPFQRLTKSWKKKRLKNTIQNHEFYFEEYLYHDQLDQYFLSRPSRSYDENLQLKSDNLDVFYFATKLKIACDMVSRNMIIQANYQCDFLEELTQFYHKNEAKFSQIPAITVYYQVLQMLQSQADEANYHQLKTLLAQNLMVFPQEELRILYDYARNYCIQQINKGKLEYYQEVLELYQFLLKQRIIFKNNYLTQWDYKNIVTVGVRLKAFEWTESFIHTYKNQLPPSERENAFSYNLAVYYYATQQYKAALQLIYEVKFVDVTYHIGVKTIQLKSYYELNESEAFYALIDTLSIYVRRNRKLSDYRKKAAQNFLKMARKIYQFKEQQGVISKKAFQEKQEVLHEMLKNSNPITNKDWLTQILNP